MMDGNDSFSAYPVVIASLSLFSRLFSFFRLSFVGGATKLYLQGTSSKQRPTYEYTVILYSTRLTFDYHTGTVPVVKRLLVGLPSSIRGFRISALTLGNREIYHCRTKL